MDAELERTYGGKIENYGNELKQPDQLLNGEYGAWRTVGNHTGERYTEEKFCDILERKAQLAESVKDSVCGQFLWVLQSHRQPPAAVSPTRACDASTRLSV